MKVLLIDDHQLFRSGLRTLLSGLQSNIEFVESNDCASAIDVANKDEVDLVLLDLYLPGTEGFDALELIKSHYHCSIVVLSSEDEPRVIRSAIAQGAVGFIPKSSSPEVLIAALQLVLANGVYLPPHVLSDYTDSVQQLGNDRDAYRNDVLNQLTERQLGVLAQAARGKSNKVIARELHIAEGTVKAHLSACYRVLEVNNRTEAVYATASLNLFG